MNRSVIKAVSQMQSNCIHTFECCVRGGKKKKKSDAEGESRTLLNKPTNPGIRALQSYSSPEETANPFQIRVNALNIHKSQREKEHSSIEMKKIKAHFHPNYIQIQSTD